ncbi:MAG: hypothetical protein E6Q97_10460 [Desulfurellales bacterium]|nr:MAG: hypothetical protein E6Q97_10460 [Desulfurellales bacterium]
MSEPDPTKIFRAPGRLIANPSGYDPSGSHGGTVLGAVTGVYFDPGIRYEPVYHDELGKVGDYVAMYEEPLLYAVFRSWDADVLNRLFPSASGGVVTLGGLSFESLAANKAAAILYAPDDPEAPGVYLVNAVPITDMSDRGMALSILRESNLFSMFMGLPSSLNNGLSGKMGKTSLIL